MERSFWSTIRGKLLTRTLVVAVIPVLIIGGVAVASLISLSRTADDSVTTARATLSEEVVGTRLAGVADQIARELGIFLNERVTDVEEWSTDAGYVEAAKAASDQAIELGLVDMEIEEIEAQFADDPRLGDAIVERDLLNSVENTPAFKEIFITDVHGFNVDFSNQTSDFVQSDEGWWTRAMENGLDISEIEFDASAGVFALDISIRLEDGDQPVGVLKAALDVQVIQTIADRFAGSTEALDITIVDKAGQFLAETSSDHDPNHIMNAIFLAQSPTASTAFVREVYQSNARELHADGFSISSEGVGGFAHVGDALVGIRSDMRSELRAFDWTVVVEQPTEVAFAAVAPIEDLAEEITSTSNRLVWVLIAVGIIGTIVATAMALVFARRITSPIGRLRDAAVTAADVSLPQVVEQIDQLEPGEELPEIEPLLLKTGDEVEDLAEAFNSVHQTAARLASEQARMRRKNVATTFVNLGRRNQNLLSRQLEHINEMESNETNPASLDRLFQLDHLATRMRRNAESLLVLAGEETPRRFRKPVTMHQLLQAAGGEIEDFARIELTAIDEAAVEGGAASDIAHLLAELLENASTFSPPDAPIQVHGRRRENGYLLSILDHGIGMEEDALKAANSRLSDPAEFDRAPSAYLGHFVVGHLARRHGISVQVADSPYGGLTAQLLLPAAILSTTQVADKVAVEAAPVDMPAAALDMELESVVPDYPPASLVPPMAPHGNESEGFPPLSSVIEPVPDYPPQALNGSANHGHTAGDTTASPFSQFAAPAEAAPDSDVAPAHNPAPNSDVAPAHNPAPNSDVAPAHNPAPNSDVAPAHNPAPNSDVAPAHNPAPNSDVAPAHNPAPNSDVAPAHNPAPNSDVAPAHNPAPNSDVAPAHNAAPDNETACQQDTAFNHEETFDPDMAFGQDAPFDHMVDTEWEPVEPVLDLVEAPTGPEPEPAQVGPTSGSDVALDVTDHAVAEPAAPAEQVFSPEPVAVQAPEQAQTPSPAPWGEPMPAPPDNLTPSGFRKRRRGHEGAPQALPHAARTTESPQAPRRSPEQVRASLSAFRSGMETGRVAVASTTESPNDVPQGDNR